MFIHGLVVVNQASHNSQAASLSEGAIYQGIDRSPWQEIDNAIYSGSASSELLSLRKEKCSWGEPTIGFGLCRSYQVAKKLFDYSNEKRQSHNLIAVLSSRLLIEAAWDLAEPESEFLGFDLYIDGFGSLINLGIKTVPSAFTDIVPHLNKNCLFESKGPLIDHYLSEYLKRTKDFNLEPIDDVIQLVDMVHLWEVL